MQCSHYVVLCAICAGVLVGILLRYGLPTSRLTQFIFSRGYDNYTCSEDYELEIGEIIQVSSWNANLTEGGDSFLCSVVGKVFRDEEGNYIRQTVSLTYQHHIIIHCSGSQS